MPNAYMIKNRFNSSQWLIRKRLETMPGPLKRNEQPSRLKRNELQMLKLVSPKAAQEKDEYGIENELQTPENHQPRK